jgi:hypothetical protein
MAQLYSIATKEINQAVCHNPEKFPAGYVIVLSEVAENEVVKNFDHPFFAAQVFTEARRLNRRSF